MSVYILKVFRSFLIFISYNASASDNSNCTRGSDRSYCSNYYMFNGKCIACPSGTYGSNCSEKCPQNYYGELCRHKCSCNEDQYCNYVYGCSACTIGIHVYGQNCSMKCPENMYGKLCNQTCSCNEDQYCDLVYGCSESSMDQPDKVIIWICTPPGIIFVVFIFGFYIWWKRKKSPPRNFVDIPHIYSHTSDFLGNSGNSVSNNTNTTDRKTINANGNRKTTEDTDSLVKGSCDEEHETGTYSKLTLRLNYYEEPVRHTPLAKSYSDTPSLPIGPSEHSEKKIHCQSKIKRISSLRTVKSTTELDSWNLGGIPSEKYAKDASKTTANHTQSLEDCSNVYDFARKEDKNYKGVPLRQDFLKELTTQLMNVKKY